MDTVVLRNKINLFLSFFRRKTVIISLLSTGFTLGILAVGVYYVRFRQNTSPVRAEGVQLKLVSTSTSVKSGDEFNVDVYIDTKGMNVTGSDVRIKYNSALLLAENIQAGNFLPVVFVPGQTSSGQAHIVLGCNPADPKNGNGILTSIKFKVLGQGTNATISFDASTAVSALGQTMNVVGAPTSLNIDIAPGATGNPTATPTDTPISTPSPSATPVNTPSGSSSPTATPSGSAKVGDINGDGNINIVDIGVIIDNYGKNPIPNPKADLNNDGTVNIVDVGIVIDNYGK